VFEFFAPPFHAKTGNTLDFFRRFARILCSPYTIRTRNMDSKHRHELEQNELAKWIVHQYEDWIKPNSSWLGYAILGLLIVLAVIVTTMKVNAWNTNAAWKQFYVALHSENPNVELELVANSTGGVVGTHARLALAQRQLIEGSSEAFFDRAKAITILEQAVTSFQQTQKAASDAMILQQAGFGLGQCWETLATVRVGDDLAKAEEEYKKVVERWETGFMKQRAQKQLAWIQQPATVMFITRLAEKVPEMSPGTLDFSGVKIDPTDPFFPGEVSGGGFDLDSMFNQRTVIEEPKSDTETESEQDESEAEASEPAPTEETNTE